MNASRRDRQFFCFILISSSIRGWGMKRKGVTAVCEVLNKDAAMTALLAEQWNISVLIPGGASTVSYLWQIMTSKQPPILSGRVSFWFLLPLRWILTVALEKWDYFISTLVLLEKEHVMDVLGLTRSDLSSAQRIHAYTQAHTDQGEANWWISLDFNISETFWQKQHWLGSNLFCRNDGVVL